MSAAAKRQNVVLVACGSFNPITNMHLRMFEAARDALRKSGRYRVLAGIVSPVSDGYGKDGLLEARHRLAMARLALQQPPASWVKLGAWEAGRRDWTPTRQVLDHYQSVIDSCAAEASADDSDSEDREEEDRRRKRRKLEDGEDFAWLRSLFRRLRRQEPSAVARPMLLCGADVLRTFATPGVWLEEDMVAIVRDFGMAVVTRPGSSPQRFVYEFDLINPYERNIAIVAEWCNSDLSSTLVRRALRRNESVRYLLPDSVIDYIFANSLYSCTAQWPSEDNLID